MAHFTGYRHIAGKGEQYAINAPGLDELWAKSDAAQRRRLVERMKQQGRFDFVTYYPVKNIQNTVIGWILGELDSDDYGVVIEQISEAIKKKEATL